MKNARKALTNLFMYKKQDRNIISVYHFKDKYLKKKKLDHGANCWIQKMFYQLRKTKELVK